MIGRVLILVPNDSLGGAEQHLKNIATYYISKNYFVEVRFLTKEKTGSWRNLGEECHLFFTNSVTEKYGLIPFLKKLIVHKNVSYDFLYTSHVHLTGIAGFLMYLRIIDVKKFIGRESTSIFKRFTSFKLMMFKILYKIGYGKLDLLICQTGFMKDQLVQALPNLASKINIQVIPNPINIENTKAEALNFEFLDQKYIVSAGRLIPEKGFDILIQAFALLQIKFPDLKLVILGEGAEREKLEALSKKLDISKKVMLIGFRNNVYPYFSYAKACIVSSRIEGFPNVLLQMMSQNTAIVSTLCAGGINEIPSIYTCEPNDVDKLAYEIEQSLKMNNKNNRQLFNNFLIKRSVPNFIEQVNQFLDV